MRPVTYRNNLPAHRIGTRLAQYSNKTNIPGNDCQQSSGDWLAPAYCDRRTDGQTVNSSGVGTFSENARKLSVEPALGQTSPKGVAKHKIRRPWPHGLL